MPKKGGESGNIKSIEKPEIRISAKTRKEEDGKIRYEASEPTDGKTRISHRR
jgi:hypothetical protein